MTKKTLGRLAGMRAVFRAIEADTSGPQEYLNPHEAERMAEPARLRLQLHYFVDQYARLILEGKWDPDAVQLETLARHYERQRLDLDAARIRRWMSHDAPSLPVFVQ